MPQILVKVGDPQKKMKMSSWKDEVGIKCGVSLENDPDLAKVTTKEELKKVSIPHLYDIKTQEQGIYFDKVMDNATAKLVMEYVGNIHYE